MMTAKTKQEALPFPTAALPIRLSIPMNKKKYG